MKNEIVNIKDNWFDTLKTTLSTLVFVEQDNVFVKEYTAYTRNQFISINGQQINQGGQQVKVKHQITLNGDGWVADENEESKREFTQVVFETFIDDKSQGQVEECLFWDETETIRNYIKTIFNI